MSRLVIFFIILLIWIVFNLVKAGQNRSGAGRKPQRIPAPVPFPEGKKCIWAWMQTAGALQLQFIRPDENRGRPAIRGSVQGIEVMIQALPGSPDSEAASVFNFHFPVAAEIGLNLILARNPHELAALSKGGKSLPPQKCGIAGRLPEHFLQVRNPEILESCLSPEYLDHLKRLNRIYPLITLSDSELLVRASGINSDPDGFRNQLSALLAVASDFAVFSSRCAERKKAPVRKIEEPAIEPKQNGTASEADEKKSSADTPELVESPAPVLPLRKNVFLHRLWSGNMTPQQQKKLFASFKSAEVEWDGVLKMAYPFSSDFVFSGKEGVKAILELEEFKPDGGIMPIKIKAVAAFPKETAKQFSGAYGKNFRFRGNLLKIEPVSKELYLTGCCITGKGGEV